MSSRFITGMLSAMLGGFIVVATQALTVTTVGWVAFGVAAAIVAVTAFAQLDRSRGAVQRSLDLGLVVLGGLLMAFGVAASGTAVIWPSFAFALGVVAFAVAGLTLNEISTWRAEHQLGQLRWLPQEGPTARSIEHPANRAA
jgi:hypothetical protein